STAVLAAARGALSSETARASPGAAHQLWPRRRTRSHPGRVCGQFARSGQGRSLRACWRP
ncbi:MAG: hypothetical protein ACK56F_04405, partial [bacterium]